MNVDAEDRIFEFEEKPAHPKSNLASMGIYVFTWSKLRQYLIDDEADPNSSNDFGKNILPNMLGDEQRLFAYVFDGYWKDVGTLDSLWEANMDIINPKVPLELKDRDFRIYARNYAKAPSYIDPKASIKNSMISDGCTIKGTVENCIISTGCVIEEGAVVKNTVIMPDSVVEKDAKVIYAIIGEKTVVHEAAEVGKEPAECPAVWGLSVVGSNRVIEKGQVIGPKEVV